MSAREAVLGLYPGPVLAQPRPRSPHLYLHPRLNPPLRASPRPPRSSPRIAPPAAAAVTSTAPSPLPPSPSPPPPSPSPPPLSPPLPSSSLPPQQLLPHRLRPNSYSPLAVAPTTVAPPPVAAVTVALAAFALTLASATVSTPPPPLPSPPQQLHQPHQQPVFRDRDPLTASTSAAGASTGARNARRKRPPPAANPHRPNSHRCNHVLTLTYLTGVVATRAECAQRVQFEWCAARAAREACGVRAACTARGLGGPRAGGAIAATVWAFCRPFKHGWGSPPMPDALFHYGLHAHMRSSCIRRS